MNRLKTKEYVFNHKDSFVAAKIFRANLTQYMPGMPFDASVTSVRRLRQMYDTGMIKPIVVDQKEEKVDETPESDNEPVSQVQENGQDGEAQESDESGQEEKSEESSDEVVEVEKQSARRGRPKKAE